nr:PPA1309 family protein [Rhodococcus rhodnii]
MSEFGGYSVRHPERALSHSLQDALTHVEGSGWDQPPALFALVPTEALAVAEPHLADRLDDGVELTAIEQQPVPDDVEGGSPALDEYLGTLRWPASVAGCALVEEILVLPPEASETVDAEPTDQQARAAAHSHPDGRRARLAVGVVRNGPSLVLLHLEPEDDDPYGEGELVTYEGLGADLVDALYATLDADPDDY